MKLRSIDQNRGSRAPTSDNPLPVPRPGGRPRAAGERGIFLPLVAMMIFAIFAVIGLAVDGGHLHRSRLELQKAADAGVIAASKRFALTPSTGRDAAWKIKVLQDAHLVIRANLEANHGSLTSSLNVQMDASDVDLDNETVRLNVTWNVGLYVLGNFPGYSSNIPIKVASKAQVRKALISMILDTSFSMFCPATGNDCSCAQVTPPLCADPKARRVIGATRDFADLFNEKRDMFDVTWFSTAARTDYFMSIGGGFLKSDLDDHVESILLGNHLSGSTNTCDGLFRSYIGTLPASVYQHRGNVARVIFTDGAPAAARFFFAQPTTALPVNHLPTMPADAIYNYDYYQWAIDWFETAADSFKPGNAIPGVSDLAKAEVPYNWTFGHVPEFNSDPDFDWMYPGGIHSTTPCSVQDKEFPNPVVAYSSCLTGFGFYVPDSRLTGAIYGSGVPWMDYRKQFYHCAIAMGDFLRRDGSTVYAVSIGDDPGLSSDPYQDPYNDHSRKDCFLARLAADPEPANPMCRAIDFVYPYSPTSEFGRQAIMVPGQYQTGAQGNHGIEGKYVYGLDATYVKSLLVNEIYPRLAKKMKTAVLIPYE